MSAEGELVSIGFVAELVAAGARPADCSTTGAEAPLSGAANTMWMRSSWPPVVVNPSPAIGHGVTMCAGRIDGSSEASSFARSRAAMFDWDTRCPSTERMSNESPPAPWLTCSVPIRSRCSRESVSSTSTSRWSAPPRTSAACASGDSVSWWLSSTEETLCVGRLVDRTARAAPGARESRFSCSPTPPWADGVADRLQLRARERLVHDTVCVVRQAAPLVHAAQRLDAARSLRGGRHQRAGEARARLADLQGVQRLAAGGAGAELAGEILAGRTRRTRSPDRGGSSRGTRRRSGAARAVPQPWPPQPLESPQTIAPSTPVSRSLRRAVYAFQNTARMGKSIKM